MFFSIIFLHILPYERKWHMLDHFMWKQHVHMPNCSSPNLELLQNITSRIGNVIYPKTNKILMLEGEEIQQVIDDDFDNQT